MVLPGTINEDIEYGRANGISHRNLNNSAYIHYKGREDTIKIPIDPLINKYRYLFDEYVEYYEVNEDFTRMYKFSPKKLSNDLYGTPEYWSILLYINECHSILDFNPINVVKIFQADQLESIVNEILILERGY